MRLENTRNDLRQAMGRAILAIEDQKHARIANLSADQKAQRSALHDVLDRSRETIFAGINEAVVRNERTFALSAVPQVRDACAEIFRNSQAGLLDAEMLDDWLYAQDLAHVFRASADGLRW